MSRSLRCGLRARLCDKFSVSSSSTAAAAAAAAGVLNHRSVKSADLSRATDPSCDQSAPPLC